MQHQRLSVVSESVLFRPFIHTFIKHLLHASHCHVRYSLAPGNTTLLQADRASFLLKLLSPEAAARGTDTQTKDALLRWKRKAIGYRKAEGRPLWGGDTEAEICEQEQFVQSREARLQLGRGQTAQRSGCIGDRYSRGNRCGHEATGVRKLGKGQTTQGSINQVSNHCRGRVKKTTY